MDNFLKSQTFKTGVFVLVVLFILMFVFKLGILHGYKKAIFHQSYGSFKHQNVGGMHFRHQGSALKKDSFGNYTAKFELMKEKRLIGSKQDLSESDKEISAE